MAIRLNPIVCSAAALLVSFTAVQAQLSSPAPAQDSKKPDVVQAVAPEAAKSSSAAAGSLPSAGKTADHGPMLLVQASPATATAAPAAGQKTSTTSTTT